MAEKGNLGLADCLLEELFVRPAEERGIICVFVGSSASSAKKLWDPEPIIIRPHIRFAECALVKMKDVEELVEKYPHIRSATIVEVKDVEELVEKYPHVRSATTVKMEDVEALIAKDYRVQSAAPDHSCPDHVSTCGTVEAYVGSHEETPAPSNVAEWLEWNPFWGYDGDKAKRATKSRNHAKYPVKRQSTSRRYATERKR